MLRIFWRRSIALCLLFIILFDERGWGTALQAGVLQECDEPNVQPHGSDLPEFSFRSLERDRAWSSVLRSDKHAGTSNEFCAIQSGAGNETYAGEEGRSGAGGCQIQRPPLRPRG